jgi:hypothetical protein
MIVIMRFFLVSPLLPVPLYALALEVSCRTELSTGKALQLGVGVRRGTEATGHPLQTALALDLELRLVRINHQDAFNSLSHLQGGS